MTIKEKHQYIIDHYATTETRVIAEALGYTPLYVKSYANKHGVTKTDEVKNIYRRRAMATVRARHDTHHPNSLRNLYDEDPERKARRIKKLSATLQKIRASERRRLLYGLPQRTRLKVERMPSAAYKVRHRMRQRGYILKHSSMTAFITDNTERSQRIERTAQKYGITLKFAI